jgi:hypothetical protein
MKCGRAPDTMGQIVTKSILPSASSSVGRQVSSQLVRRILGAIVKR